MTLRFGILGPLEVRRDDVEVDVGSGKHRDLLAILLLADNNVVSSERLVDWLWDGHPPATASNNLQVLVSQLRSRLQPGRPKGTQGVLQTRSPGYQLVLDDEAVDARRFERLTASARETVDAGDLPRAEQLLSDALALWHGEPLPEFDMRPFAEPELARLREARLVAIELRVDVQLRLGRASDVIGPLQALVAENPLREALRAHLMLALYRCGRQAEALEVYQATRQTLIEELGIEPGRDLQRLNSEILQQAATLDLAPAAAARRQPAPRPARAPRRAARRAMRSLLRPRSLPAPPTGLVGREREQQAVGSLLDHDQARLVTIVGPGGTGKTRLSIAVAAARQDAFADGTVFVPLAPLTSAEQVAPAIAQALGVADVPDQPIGRTLAHVLSRMQLLLVLDNFEHVSDAAPLVSELLLAAPQLRVLATSREPLDLYGEHLYELEPLPLPPADGATAEVIIASPAVQLFVQRAGAVRPGFEASPANAPLLAQVCERLDGLPLAIELAASRMRSFGLEELLALLDERLTVLQGGPRDLPDRQRSLRAAIEWSHRLLAPAERQLFAMVATFAGGCALASAEQVCAPELSIDGTLEELLQSLVDRSFLRRVVHEDHPQPRYVMLQTLWEYAREQLEQQPEHAALADRHAEHYLALAAATAPLLATSAQVEALLTLRAEHDNLRVALERLLVREDPNPAAELAASLARFWQTIGTLHEAAAVLGRALAHPGRLEPRTHARLLDAAGRVARARHQLDEGTAHHEASLELCRTAGDRAGMASALVGIGDVHAWRGEHEEAARCFDEAIEHARAAGDDATRAWALNYLGLSRSCMGEYDAALELFGESAGLLEQLGDDRTRALVRNNLATELAYAGEPARARELLDWCSDVFRAHGDRRGLAMTTANLADVALTAGEPEEAARHAREAIALAERLDDPVQAVVAQQNLAWARALLGDVEGAEPLFRDSVIAARALDDPRLAAQGLLGLGHVAVRAEDPDRAAEIYAAAAALSPEPPPPGLAAVHAADVAWIERHASAEAREPWSADVALEDAVALASTSAASPER